MDSIETATSTVLMLIAKVSYFLALLESWSWHSVLSKYLFIHVAILAIPLITVCLQPFTEQLGWQIEEEPPFFTDWNVREHWAPVLHFTLSAISGKHCVASHIDKYV
jgi:hypothetical protein